MCSVGGRGLTFPKVEQIAVTNLHANLRLYFLWSCPLGLRRLGLGRWAYQSRGFRRRPTLLLLSYRLLLLLQSCRLIPLHVYILLCYPMLLRLLNHCLAKQDSLRLYICKMIEWWTIAFPSSFAAEKLLEKPAMAIVPDPV